MKEVRENILKILIDEILRTKKYCDAKRYNSKSELAKNPHDIRNKYLSSLSSLINTYTRLSRDMDIDELQKEIEMLKEQFYDEFETNE